MHSALSLDIYVVLKSIQFQKTSRTDSCHKQTERCALIVGNASRVLFRFGT